MELVDYDFLDILVEALVYGAEPGHQALLKQVVGEVVVDSPDFLVGSVICLL